MTPKVIAHRGHIKDHPENTLSAFKAAQTTGADAIELDVHMTRDGQLVVHHDYYLGNPDDGEGLIFQKDWAYVAQLKVGEQEKIPTLASVFAVMGDSIEYELELKGFSEDFLQKVIALTHMYNLASHIEFTSPLPAMLTRLKQLEPVLRTGIFVAPYPGWMGPELGRTLAVNSALLAKADVLHCPLGIIDGSLIALARSQGLKVHAANCDSDTELAMAMEQGVDQLSTNELERALAVRERLGG